MKFIATGRVCLLSLGLAACGGSEAVPGATVTGTITQDVPTVVANVPSPVPTVAPLALPASTPLPVIASPVATLPAQPPPVRPASPVPQQQAPPARPATGNLSSRLQQLADLAAAGTLAASPQAQAQQVGLPASGPGSLQRDGAGVVVEARLINTSGALLDAIRAAGGRVISVYEPSPTATLAIEPARLRAVAAVPGVVRIDEALGPGTN